MKEPVHLETIQKRFVEKGVWVRPFGRLVYVMPPYVMPPYVITNEELGFLTRAMCEVVEEVT